MSLKPAQNLLRRVARLQSRLAEAEDTLDAIRSGSVDALVVRTPRGEQLFTLKGADQTYRTLVEAMNEGALTLSRSTISYCNHRFSRMARVPMERIMGTSIFEWVRSTEFRQLVGALNKGRRRHASLESVLRTGDGREMPVLLSASCFETDRKRAVGLLLTDITERKEAERARHELSRRILNAQELERQRVARDLHDGVNQLLSSAKYHLNNCRLSSGAQSHQSVQQALRLVEKAVAEVRLISRNLRPSELDDLGLASALRSLACEFESQTGIRTHVEGQSNGELPAELELALYRIAQEALNNVANHAQATRVELALLSLPARAALTIRDNGKGLPRDLASRQRRGWGLKNMKTRASLLGGSFSLQPAPAGGTCVSVSIPIPGLHGQNSFPTSQALRKSGDLGHNGSPTVNSASRHSAGFLFQGHTPAAHGIRKITPAPSAP